MRVDISFEAYMVCLTIHVRCQVYFSLKHNIINFKMSSASNLSSALGVNQFYFNVITDRIMIY